MSKFDLIDTQRQFINAAAEHLGVPLDRLMEASHVQGGASCKQPLAVAFVVYLEPKDLPAIAEHMKRNADRESAEALDKFLGDKPTAIAKGGTPL